MRRRAALLAVGAAALSLGACVHLPYLPGDGPFVTRADREEAAAPPAAARDARVDPVQHARTAKPGDPPPCKFGGRRCPPWERAWPADAGITPADKVSDTGKVKRKPAPPPADAAPTPAT